MLNTPPRQLAEADLAAQARQTALQLSQGIQTGTKTAAESFNRFVDGDDNSRPATDKRDFWDSFGEAPTGPANDKKDFWDDFAAAGETAATQKKHTPSSSIGTSAMKKPQKPQGGDDTWGDW
jgi:ADP-ribosylation factor GTPase-activating protein 1